VGGELVEIFEGDEVKMLVASITATVQNSDVDPKTSRNDLNVAGLRGRRSQEAAQ
jgi:hypothetical protein